MFEGFLSASAMDILLFAVAIALFIAALAALQIMNRRRIKFPTRVFAGLGLGLILGLILQVVFGRDSRGVELALPWIRMVGTIYVNLLRMIVIPLVMVAVISAIVGLRGQGNVRQIGGLVLTVLLTTTAIAALVGALMTAGFGLTTAGLERGAAEDRSATQLEERLANVQADLPSQIASMVPSNPFLDMTGARGTSVIAVVVFSAFVGFAILRVAKRQPELGDRLQVAVRAVHDVVMEIVKMVLRLTPFGVLALVTNIVAGSDWAQILKLINFVLLSYVAILIMFVIHLLILTLFGLNPVTYVRKAWSTLVFAFASRSSAGTLPLTIKTQTDQMGVPPAIANMGSSFAVTIGQNGCAGIYPAMLAVMVAPTLGINPLEIGFLLKLIVIVAISSFGIAGVGGGATYAGLVVLSSMGLPVWIAALLISVEPLIDMARTALNVSGAFVATLVTSRVRKELNTSVYNDPNTALVEEGPVGERSAA